MKPFSTTFTPPISRHSVLKFDVADFKTDRFICTMEMPYNSLFTPRIEEILDYIYSKRPTLRYRKIILEFEEKVWK